MGSNPLEIDKVNDLIRAVDEHLDSLRLARDLLDEVKDAAACRELDAQIRDLRDQQRMLSKRWMAIKAMGRSPAGLFGFSHMLGGYSGGQAEYLRVPMADVGPIKVPDSLADEQALFLSDIFPPVTWLRRTHRSKMAILLLSGGCGPVGPLPAVHVVFETAPVAVPITYPAITGTLTWRLFLEGGVAQRSKYRRHGGSRSVVLHRSA